MSRFFSCRTRRRRVPRAALRRLRQLGERRDLWYTDARRTAESLGPEHRPCRSRVDHAALTRLLCDPPPLAVGGSAEHVSALAVALALGHLVALTPHAGRRGLQCIQQQAAFVRVAVCQARLAARAAAAAAAAAAEQQQKAERAAGAGVCGRRCHARGDLASARCPGCLGVAATVACDQPAVCEAGRPLSPPGGDRGRAVQSGSGCRGDSPTSEDTGSSAGEDTGFWEDGVGGCASQWGAAVRGCEEDD